MPSQSLLLTVILYVWFCFDTSDIFDNDILALQL